MKRISYIKCAGKVACVLPIACMVLVTNVASAEGRPHFIGAYAGLNVGNASLDLQDDDKYSYSSSGASYALELGMNFSPFNFTNKAWYPGANVQFGTLGDLSTDKDGEEYANLTGTLMFTAFSARMSYAVNPLVLVFASLGAGFERFNGTTYTNQYSWEPIIGLGAAYYINDHVSVSANYQHLFGEAFNSANEASVWGDILSDGTTFNRFSVGVQYTF